MQVSTRRLKYKLKKYGVNTDYVQGWDSAAINVYAGSPSVGLILHHTAGTNSLSWVTTGNPYAPVRACHFLVNRDGTVSVTSGSSAYHAGSGGPYTFKRRTLPNVTVPKDQGNAFLYGIEIESLGKTAAINGTKGGMTTDQIVSTALLCAALLNAMRPFGLSYPVDRVIRHQDWTTRKPDVKQDLDWWHQVVGIARRNKTDSKKTRKEITSFIKANPKGVLVAKPKPTPTPKPKPERTETGQFVVGPVPKSDPPAVVVCEVVPAKAAPKPKPAPKPAPKPVVKLSDLKPRQKNASVGTVQKALQKEVGLAPQATPLFNVATKAAYAKWQKKLGYTGADADGLPGRASLLKLGKKHGFTVKAT